MVAEAPPLSRTRARRRLVVTGLLWGGLLLGACGQSEPAPSAADPESDAADRARPAGGRAGSVPAAELLGSAPYPSTELGALSGEVRFLGQPRKRFVLGAARKPECSQHPEVDQRTNVLVVADGKLADAFVHLKSGVDPTRIPAAEPATFRLEQKGCMYVPRAVALRVGQRLLVTNDDPTVHNVHTLGKRNGESNRSMGTGQAPLEFVFERAERPVPFKCDIHPWMEADVWVEEHPWFALSAADGGFRILDVPPGEYVVEALHPAEETGRTAARVTVEAGSETRIALTFP